MAGIKQHINPVMALQKDRETYQAGIENAFNYSEGASRVGIEDFHTPAQF